MIIHFNAKRLLAILFGLVPGLVAGFAVPGLTVRILFGSGHSAPTIIAYALVCLLCLAALRPRAERTVDISVWLDLCIFGVLVGSGVVLVTVPFILLHPR